MGPWEFEVPAGPSNQGPGELLKVNSTGGTTRTGRKQRGTSRAALTKPVLQLTDQRNHTQQGKGFREEGGHRFEVCEHHGEKEGAFCV